MGGRIKEEVLHKIDVKGEYVQDGVQMQFGLGPWSGGVNGDQGRYAIRYVWCDSHGNRVEHMGSWIPIGALPAALQVVVEGLREVQRVEQAVARPAA